MEWLQGLDPNNFGKILSLITQKSYGRNLMRESKKLFPQYPSNNLRSHMYSTIHTLETINLSERNHTPSHCFSKICHNPYNFILMYEFLQSIFIPIILLISVKSPNKTSPRKDFKNPYYNFLTIHQVRKDTEKLIISLASLPKLPTSPAKSSIFPHD